jgi:hypothetical protein
MARRRGRTRYRTRTIVRRARTGGGSFKPIIDGFLAGAGGQFASKYVGIYGHPVATIGVGYFRNNNVLKTEGARELGAMLVANMVGGKLAGGGYIGG